MAGTFAAVNPPKEPSSLSLKRPLVRFYTVDAGLQMVLGPAPAVVDGLTRGGTGLWPESSRDTTSATEVSGIRRSAFRDTAAVVLNDESRRSGHYSSEIRPARSCRVGPFAWTDTTLKSAKHSRDNRTDPVAMIAQDRGNATAPFTHFSP